MGKVVMNGSVSVGGFVADENDLAGPLFDWLSSGDVPLDESGELTVSRTSYDYTRPCWDEIGATVVGRHVFDITDGWDGSPPGGIDHVVVVTHRPEPEGPGGDVDGLLRSGDVLGEVGERLGELVGALGGVVGTADRIRRSLEGLLVDRPVRHARPGRPALRRSRHRARPWAALQTLGAGVMVPNPDRIDAGSRDRFTRG